MHSKFSGLKSKPFVFSWFFGWGFWAELSQTVLLLYAVLAGVNLSAVVSGIWIRQENPKTLSSCVLYYLAFPCGLFFFLMLQNWASSWSFQDIQISYVACHFQKIILQEVKERIADLRLSCRSYTVTTAAFYWPKQLLSLGRLLQKRNSTFDGSLCSNHENITLISSARESHSHPQLFYSESTTIYVQKPQFPRAVPSQWLRVAGTLSQVHPSRCGNPLIWELF